MRKRPLIHFALILTLTCTSAKHALALVNAEKLENTPDLVRLEFSGGKSVCTGFFVTPTAIITAAHCLSDEKGVSYSLDKILGPGDEPMSLKVTKIIPHPAYSRGSSSDR